MTNEVQTSDVVLPSFHDYWCEWRDGEHTFHVMKGGRNSGKSTSLSQRFIMDLIELPINALCIRKVSNTIQESVYEQLKAATYLLDVTEYFTFSKSPLRITYKPRGNYVIFRGADDPQKLKSIKTSQFPIARAWIEELTEFKVEEELQTITDSILRAELPDGLTYKIAYSYNPPKRKQHWVNKKYESHIVPANTYIHHSTYLDNRFLSEQTLAEIEALRVANEKKYRWIYLGEPSGGGVVPFDNLNFRTITTEEMEHFDNIRQGLDWGYAVDPVAFCRMHYDKTRRKLYFLDEIYGVKVSNRELAQMMKARGYHDTMTTADSAEPKSISEMKDYGIKIRGAVKGEGSVEYGEKWLDDLEEIVIDPARTPNSAREFENIDYQVDKDGNLKAKLEDKDNHCFVGDTLIDTADGKRPIRDIKEGEFVLTSHGHRRVLRVWDNGVQNVTEYFLQSDLGEIRISATPNHLIRTGDTWTQISQLRPGQTVCLNSDSTEKSIACTVESDISRAGADACTSLSGRHISDPSLRDTMSTTGMRIRGTTTRTISKLSRRLSTFLIMESSTLYETLSGFVVSMMPALRLQRNGTLLLPATSGTSNTHRKLHLGFASCPSRSVTNAVYSSNPRITRRGSVPMPASQDSGAGLDLTTKSVHVLTVGAGSSQTNMPIPAPVPALVLTVTATHIGPREVFDLMVEDAHEYFANGVLVHNCIDQARYGCEGDMGPEPARWEIP